VRRGRLGYGERGDDDLQPRPRFTSGPPATPRSPPTSAEAAKAWPWPYDIHLSRNSSTGLQRNPTDSAKHPICRSSDEQPIRSNSRSDWNPLLPPSPAPTNTQSPRGRARTPTKTIGSRATFCGVSVFAKPVSRLVPAQLSYHVVNCRVQCLYLHSRKQDCQGRGPKDFLTIGSVIADCRLSPCPINSKKARGIVDRRRLPKCLAHQKDPIEPVPRC